MSWQSKERRTGQEKRKTDRRGPYSQNLTEVSGASDRRSFPRRAKDRLATVKPLRPALKTEDARWRELRLRTIGEDEPTPEKKPKLRLVEFKPIAPSD